MKTLLFFHILGAVLILGNTIISIFWKLKSDSTKDLRIIAHTHREIRRADRIFSHIGIILILITGLGLWHVDKIKIMQSMWLLWGIILFVVSIILWGAVIVPTERKLTFLSDKSSNEGGIDPGIIRLSKRWYNTAVIFAALIVIIMILMAYRPVF
ncbi:MAG: hypothetical protein C4291_02165 [Candidatus Dadabacteria bacterium]